MKQLPELLSPAGSPEALRAAIDGGADAVYLGGRGFNARAGAVNFDTDAIGDAVTLCHAYGVKVYLTLNTLLYDKELRAFREYAAEIYRLGVDAAIVADRGAIALLRRDIPGLPIHASTQASCHSTEGALALRQAGAERVVLARELSLPDIRRIVAEAGVETEIFIHGALCVSHSGQCLFSSLVGGRSGNRGACAQPCRLPYNGKYPLSLRDLSLAGHVPELIESGVSSLKIEGRMKSAAYVYGVTSIYRRLLDEHRVATEEENRRLRELFSRSGFTDRYFCGQAAKPMTGVRREEDKADSRTASDMQITERKIKADGYVRVMADEPSTFVLHTEDGRTVTVHGDIPQPAKSVPLAAPAVADRLSRMGGTPFLLAPEDIQVELGEGLNLSPGAINALRRDAVTALMAPPHRPFTLPAYSPERGKPIPLGRTALFFDPKTAKKTDEAVLAFFDSLFFPLWNWREGAPLIPHGIYVPPVVPDSEMGDVLFMLKEAREAGIETALVGNIGMIEPARRLGFTVIGDFRLNITNRESAAAYLAAGVSGYLVSPELTLPQWRDVGGSAIVYGRIPLMLTERCFVKENFGCDACSRVSLTDRRGAHFPLLREYPHRNLILNSLPTYMGDRKTDLPRGAGEHFLFTTESPRRVGQVVTAYRDGLPLDETCRRISK